jgi:hypothetical protein
MKRIFFVLLLLSPLAAQAQSVIDVTARGGLAYLYLPSFNRVYEFNAFQKSPDFRSALEVSGGVDVQLSGKKFLGGDFFYLTTSADLSTFGPQDKLSLQLISPSVVYSFVPVAVGAFSKLSVGLGPLFGSITRNAQFATTAYSAVGVSAFFDAIGGLALSDKFFATLEPSLRVGLSGNVTSNGQTLNYVDSSNQTKQATLSFVDLSFKLGVAFVF